MRNVAPDGTEIEWLQGLIGKASPNSIGAAGMVPTFNGTQETLTLAFQSAPPERLALTSPRIPASPPRFAPSLRPGVVRIESITSAPCLTGVPLIDCGAWHIHLRQRFEKLTWRLVGVI